MAMAYQTLSPEANRLLGTALLDPDWCWQLLGPTRILAIQGFALTPAERRAILTSPATCLHELAADVLEAMSSIPGEGDGLATPAISATIASLEGDLPCQAPILVPNWPTTRSEGRRRIGGRVV